MFRRVRLVHRCNSQSTSLLVWRYSFLSLLWFCVTSAASRHGVKSTGQKERGENTKQNSKCCMIILPVCREICMYNADIVHMFSLWFFANKKQNKYVPLQLWNCVTLLPYFPGPIFSLFLYPQGGKCTYLPNTQRLQRLIYLYFVYRLFCEAFASLIRTNYSWFLNCFYTNFWQGCWVLLSTQPWGMCDFQAIVWMIESVDLAWCFHQPSLTSEVKASWNSL